MSIRPFKSKRLLLLAAVSGLLYITLVFAMARTRRPWNDEAMFANPAWNLVQHGFLGSTVIEDEAGIPDIHRYTYWMFPFYLVLLAGWFKLVGFGLLKMRLLMSMSALVFLWEWWLLVRRWTASSTIAAAAVGLTAFDYNMLVAASFGRYDILVAALGFGGYCCYLALRERRFRLALFCSNACVAVCGATHPNGLMFLLGLWTLIFYLDRRRITWSSFGISALPYLLVAIPWAAYILQSPHSFLAQTKTNSYSRIGLFTPLASLAGEWTRYKVAFGLGAHSAGHSGIAALKAIALLAYIVAIAAFLMIRDLRADTRYRPLLLLLGVHLLYQSFVDGIKFTYYLVLVIPFYATILALVLAYFWRRRILLRFVSAFGVGVLLLMQIGGILVRVRQNEYATRYAPAVDFLRREATPSDLIFASCDFGFRYGFKDNLVDDIRLGYRSGKRPVYIVMEEIYSQNVDLWRTSQPALHQFLVDRLNREYESIYAHGGYTIYKRKALADRMR